MINAIIELLGKLRTMFFSAKSSTVKDLEPDNIDITDEEIDGFFEELSTIDDLLDEVMTEVLDETLGNAPIVDDALKTSKPDIVDDLEVQIKQSKETTHMSILDMKVKFPYGRGSRAKLETCHSDLIRIFYEVSKYHDTSIMCGHRTEADQQAAFEKGYSGVQFPNSKHNQTPSVAVDAAPYPIDWNDLERFCYFAGKVMVIADQLHREGEVTHELRWGGDWNRDEHMRDDKERKALRDYPHFELLV